MSISAAVLELFRKSRRGQILPPPAGRGLKYKLGKHVFIGGYIKSLRDQMTPCDLRMSQKIMFCFLYVCGKSAKYSEKFERSISLWAHSGSRHDTSYPNQGTLPLFTATVTITIPYHTRKHSNLSENKMHWNWTLYFQVFRIEYGKVKYMHRIQQAILKCSILVCHGWFDYTHFVFVSLTTKSFW